MMHAAERGRRLVITVGEGDDSEEIVIDPVNASTGATLLRVYLGIENRLFEDIDEYNEAGQTLGELSLGKIIPLDQTHPTERETAQIARFSEVWRQVEGLRREESTQVIAIAFYWQTDGGLEAALAAARGDDPKAQALLFTAAGLQRRSTSLPEESPRSPSGESGPPTP
jgi:hypothetical protein